MNQGEEHIYGLPPKEKRLSSKWCQCQVCGCMRIYDWSPGWPGYYEYFDAAGRSVKEELPCNEGLKNQYIKQQEAWGKFRKMLPYLHFACAMQEQYDRGYGDGFATGSEDRRALELNYDDDTDTHP